MPLIQTITTIIVIVVTVKAIDQGDANNDRINVKIIK